MTRNNSRQADAADTIDALCVSDEMVADVLSWIAASGRELTFSAEGPDHELVMALIAHVRGLLATELGKKNAAK